MEGVHFMSHKSKEKGKVQSSITTDPRAETPYGKMTKTLGNITHKTGFKHIRRWLLNPVVLEIWIYHTLATVEKTTNLTETSFHCKSDKNHLHQWGYGSCLTAVPVSTQGCSCQVVYRIILWRDHYSLEPWSSPTLLHSHMMHPPSIPQAGGFRIAGTLIGKLRLLFHQFYLFCNCWSHLEKLHMI